MFGIELEAFVATYGMLGIFIASIIANATVFLPLPIDALMLALGSYLKYTNQTIILVLTTSIVSALGAAIGEMTAYIFGLYGMKAIQKVMRTEFKQFLEIREKLHTSGMVFVVFASMTPFPFDLVGIVAGVIKYDPKRFFAAAFVGKFTRYLLIALAGYFGIEILQAFFLLG